jgi:hypothetical protein
MSLFAKDKKIGEIAVKKAYVLLKRAGYSPRIPIRVEKDHDLILGDGRRVEVKFDVVMDSTRNLGVEWWSDKIAHTPGWGQYCKADILMQFYNMDNAVVVDWPKFKLWIMENFEKFERKDSKYSNADVILIPMNQIPESVKIQDIGNMFKLDYDLARWEIEAIRGRKYRVEPAKSSRTVCVFCGESISKGHLRVGNQGGWRHGRCAVSEGILSRDSLERLQGIDELNEWQTEHMQKIVD